MDDDVTNVSSNEATNILMWCDRPSSQDSLLGRNPCTTEVESNPGKVGSRQNILTLYRGFPIIQIKEHKNAFFRALRRAIAKESDVHLMWSEMY